MTGDYKETFITRLLRNSWPGSVDVELLKAIFSMDDMDALGHWHAWSSVIEIDLLDWQSHRLLAAFVGRARKIDPDFKQLSLLEGLTKSHWTTSQVIKRNTLPAVDALLDSGIPVMFFKGLAFEIAGHSSIPSRFSGDLDVLVPRGRIREALELLYNIGWSFDGQPLQVALSKMAMDSGINLKNASGGDLDLHHQPVHAGYVDDRALRGLWSSAEKGSFLDRSILVPCLSDLLAIAASHGLRRPGKKQAHVSLWAIDFINGLSKLGGDYAQLKESAHRMNAEASVAGAVLFAFENFRDRFAGICPKQFISLATSPRQLMWLALEAPPKGRLDKHVRARLVKILKFLNQRNKVEFSR